MAAGMATTAPSDILHVFSLIQVWQGFVSLRYATPYRHNPWRQGRRRAQDHQGAIEPQLGHRK